MLQHESPTTNPEKEMNFVINLTVLICDIDIYTFLLTCMIKWVEDQVSWGHQECLWDPEFCLGCVQWKMPTRSSRGYSKRSVRDSLEPRGSRQGSRCPLGRR